MIKLMGNNAILGVVTMPAGNPIKTQPLQQEPPKKDGDDTE